MNAILDAEAATEETNQLRENRNALRQMARRVSLSITLNGGEPFEAALQDLSRRGMRLSSETNIRCGDAIMVEAAEGSGLHAVECRVMRVQLLSSGDLPTFEYGVQISQTCREHGHRWFLHFCYGGLHDHSTPEA